jgi:hypothetical protein
MNSSSFLPGNITRRPLFVVLALNFLAFFIIIYFSSGAISDYWNILWSLNSLALYNLIAGSIFMLVSIRHRPLEKYGLALMAVFVLLLLYRVGSAVVYTQFIR